MYKKLESTNGECFYCEKDKELLILKDLNQKGTLIGVCKDCIKKKRLKIK